MDFFLHQIIKSNLSGRRLLLLLLLDENSHSVAKCNTFIVTRKCIPFGIITTSCRLSLPPKCLELVIIPELHRNCSPLKSTNQFADSNPGVMMNERDYEPNYQNYHYRVHDMMMMCKRWRRWLRNVKQKGVFRFLSLWIFSPYYGFDRPSIFDSPVFSTSSPALRTGRQLNLNGAAS